MIFLIFNRRLLQKTSFVGCLVGEGSTSAVSTRLDGRLTWSPNTTTSTAAGIHTLPKHFKNSTSILEDIYVTPPVIS